MQQGICIIKTQHQGTPSLWLRIHSDIAFDPSLSALPILQKQTLESIPASREREKNVKDYLAFTRYVEVEDEIETKRSRDVGGQRRPEGCRE